MVLHLRSQVFGACIGDDLVLLDAREDAYLCVPGGAAGCIREAAGLIFPPGPIAEALDAAALLSAVPRSVEPLPALPTRSVLHDGCAPRPEPADLLPALGVVRDLGRARRGNGLVSFLDIAPPCVAGLRAEIDPVAAAARRFLRIGPWLPIEGECLVRSAMLVGWLRRRGLRAQWVFGVRLWPFAAHCWVQTEDVCLNDDIERLVAFTPIMVR